MAVVVGARDVRKTFGRVGSAPEAKILHGISVHVDAGELVSVVGPSGAGKSTLLYCLAGLEPVTSGSVLVGDVDLGRLSPGRLARFRRDHMGFVFQSYNLVPTLTVAQNVELPARLARRSIGADETLSALAEVGMEDFASARAATLSGGQQQRVALARALFTRPDVLFADEPTGALDEAAGRRVLDLLGRVSETGTAVLMVTHDLEAASRADRVLVLRGGEIHSELVRPTVDDVFGAFAKAAL